MPHFTQAYVDRQRLPKGKRQEEQIERIVRGKSLVLTLNRSGRHTWSVVYYEAKGRKKRQCKLGHAYQTGEANYDTGEFPMLTVKQALAMVAEFSVKDALASKQAGRPGSFGEIAALWFKREAKAFKSAKELRRLLDKHVLPKWATRDIGEIKRLDVALLLDDVEDAHGAGVANSVLATVSSLMRWWQTRDQEFVSPVVAGMRRKKPVKRTRFLSDEEIRVAWAACDQVEPQFGAIVRLLLLTGQRRSKVGKMRWDDVDLEKGIWSIPSEERDKGTGGVLVLPSVATDIIREQPRLEDNAFVFGSGRSGKEFNHWSQGMRDFRKLLPPDQRDWTLHDLRRTARSLMSRARVDSDVAEITLGHALTGVRGTYDRHAYTDEKRDALRRLATEIGLILSPKSKVVRIS